MIWPLFFLLFQSLPEVRVERIATGFAFTEGPAWSHDGYLVFSDIPANRMLKFTPSKGVEPFREESNGANGNAYDAQGRLYTCESHARRVTRTTKRGRLEVLADKWDGKRLNAPNDIVVTKSGSAYFTDPAFGKEADTRELDFYGVYHLTPKGDLAVVAKPKGRPNGIALSPDQHMLYVTNSDEHNVRAYALDRDGNASGERIVVQDIPGVPDGIRTDEKGNLYVAARGLLIYSPEGRLVRELPIAETPSNLAFGDGDLQTLYITARTSLYRVRFGVKGALPY